MRINTLIDLFDFYDNKCIAVTGSSGYIAWNLVRELKKYNCNIICCSRNIGSINKQRGTASIEYKEMSYQNERSINDVVNRVDIVFHLSAQNSTLISEQEPIQDYQANVLPMQLLLEQSRSAERNPMIIYTGTSTQCGIPGKIPVDENETDNPITTYDFHKLQAERWLKFYAQTDRVKGVSLRLTNVYGYGPKTSSADRGILNMMLDRALMGEPLTIYGTGENIRDYIFIDDVIKVLATVPLYIDDMTGNHYLLGSGTGTCIRDAFYTLKKVVEMETRKEVLIQHVETPSNVPSIDSRDFVADIKALRKQLQFHKTTSLLDGIKLTLKQKS